jgi:tetratricopeptide (TPR) repeat protein
VPSARYFAAFDLFYDGEYREALKVFEEESRGAIRTPQARWIDSICYHTMQGECCYALGLLDKALAHYTAAIELYLSYPDFLMRVQFPQTVGPATAQKYRAYPWGPSSRRSQPGHFPSEMLIGQGRLNNIDVLRQGGVVQYPVLLPIRVQEIVRTLSWAIRRRTELLGPLTPHDPLTSKLLAVLSRSPAPPNHWSQAWIDIPHGLALIAAGKAPEAIPLLNRSLVVVGQYDHPLTGLALLELGRLAMARGDLDSAITLFHDATVSAYQFDDGHLLEEAFRHGALAHLLAGRKGLHPAVEPALRWAKVQDLRALRVTLLLSLAEQFLAEGATAEAFAAIKEAEETIGRREMGEGRLGAELQYLRAIAEYQRGNLAAGDTALSSALDYLRRGSLWLFQIRQLDTQFITGNITPQGPITSRTAMEIYGQLLRDPEAGDWTFRPMEALAVTTLASPQSFGNWFLVALARKEPEAAVEIADRARRYRFWNMLPLGGRLLALRWILEAPEGRLPAQAALERQQILVHFPQYEALSRQARELLRQLRQQPLFVPEAEAAGARLQQWSQLTRIAQQQEAKLREIALRRFPATMVFPPQRSFREIREQLPEGSAALIFFAVGTDLYAFLATRDQYDQWKIKSAEALEKRLITLLRAWGQAEANRELAIKELKSVAWQKEAQELLRLLVEGSRADLLGNISELLVVPDGIAWYIPFEALGGQKENKFQSIISTKPVRYLPVLSLTVPGAAGRRLAPRTLVVLGKLHPQEPPEMAQQVFDLLAERQTGFEALTQPLSAPSLAIKPLLDQLVVWDDLRVDLAKPLSLGPISALGKGPGNTLADWISLPWGGPDIVVLPGFHTPMENALRQYRSFPVGAELLATSCGLMATGSRTILVSRWRTGGSICAELLREFLQEVPHTPAAQAWRRAVILCANWPVRQESEPRVARSAEAAELTAEHPFFWAGYMLFDCGLNPQLPETPAEPPAVEMAPPQEPQAPPAPPPAPAEAPGPAQG